MLNQGEKKTAEDRHQTIAKYTSKYKQVPPEKEESLALKMPEWSGFKGLETKVDNVEEKKGGFEKARYKEDVWKKLWGKLGKLKAKSENLKRKF